VLIIVQNLPVPLDRRVWLECQALTAAGYGVSVICPKGPGDPNREAINGVRLYKYAPPPPARGVAGYMWEFAYCWLRTALLSVVVLWNDGFSVIQACNPPDTYWALARLYKFVGKKFVYDQHDLNPEVFRSRFGEPRGFVSRLQHRILLMLERKTYRTADRVITPNESYKRIAQERGDVEASAITVVRSGPNTAEMRPIHRIPELMKDRSFLLTYLGVMGPQDGVDIVLRMLDIIVNKWGRRDIHTALLGFGDSYDGLVDLAHELNLDDYVTFTGRAEPPDIARYLSTADIGICPDPPSPLNDVSTMNKTMEYMSFALPAIAFDLPETQISGGDAVAYVETGGAIDDSTIERFAAAVVELLGNEDRRAEMAVAGRRRAEQVLDWAPQRSAYVGVFDELFKRTASKPEIIGQPGAESRAAAMKPAGDVRWLGSLVDVTNDAEIRAFAKTWPKQLPAAAGSNVPPIRQASARVPQVR
jgi:glycosyltransferase involved in cell wall biosynthesis